jgi:uncharacterized protein YcbX
LFSFSAPVALNLLLRLFTMPIVTELTLYPIKACGGISLQQATVTPAGLAHGGVHDREWMVVDLQGQFLSQRHYPMLATAKPALESDCVLMQSPGLPPLRLPLQRASQAATMEVQVWKDRLPAEDCGDEAAAWFSTLINHPCRLVRFHPQAQRLASKKWTGDIDVPTRFADGYPMLLISQASLDDLNEKLLAQGRSAVPMNRFRPNIVVKGIEAFEEDYAEYFDTDTISLKPVKPCPRCPVPGIDQVSGEVGPNPVDILQSYRALERVDGGIGFGMNTILQRGAGEVLRVGDELECEIAF